MARNIADKCGCYGHDNKVGTASKGPKVKKLATVQSGAYGEKVTPGLRQHADKITYEKGAKDYRKLY